MKILVSGGAGFIGSHTSLALLKEGHNVIIMDNLCNSSQETVGIVEQIAGKKAVFLNIDITDENAVNGVFSNHDIKGVIHLAGKKAVGESVHKPLEYYRNNILGTIVLAQACLNYGVKKFVFSSSATVYGDNEVPFQEDMALKPATNPYGETKIVSERILEDVSKIEKDLCLAFLRYFNPVGGHESGLLGENPNGIPNNLMPYIVKVAKGELPYLEIFGDDYPTSDGTGVRDYLHVMDLAEAHVAAFENLTPGVHVYNLGTGQGISVLQLVKAFEEANNVRVPYKIVGRRPGDIALCYADVRKAERELGWKARRGLREMCVDAFRYENSTGKVSRT